MNRVCKIIDRNTFTTLKYARCVCGVSLSLIMIMGYTYYLLGDLLSSLVIHCAIFIILITIDGPYWFITKSRKQRVLIHLLSIAKAMEDSDQKPVSDRIRSIAQPLINDIYNDYVDKGISKISMRIFT